MTASAPTAPKVLTPEEQEQEIEARVTARLKEVQKRTYQGWIIRAPLFGMKSKDGSPLGVTETLTVHPHEGLTEEACREKKCTHKPGKSPEEGGCPTRLVQSPPIDMYAGQGVTSDELVAIWFRDYMGYNIEPADPETNSLARTAALASVVK
jgi:hypothetical protein